MIYNRERLNQFVDYSNLTIGSIHPTDSDGEIEYKDKAWIFFEIKYRSKELPFGQSLALKRKIDDISKAGKPAVLFVAEHYVDDVRQDIDAAECIVRNFYYQGKWYQGDGSDLKAYTNRFVGMVDGIN